MVAVSTGSYSCSCVRPLSQHSAVFTDAQAFALIARATLWQLQLCGRIFTPSRTLALKPAHVTISGSNENDPEGGIRPWPRLERGRSTVAACW
jgi:hypothetical protein